MSRDTDTLMGIPSELVVNNVADMRLGGEITCLRIFFFYCEFFFQEQL